MTEVIGVRFKRVGKVYYFNPDKLDIPAGANVIVETARGVEMGEVVLANHMVEDGAVVQPLKKVIRVATDQGPCHRGAPQKKGERDLRNL